LIESIGVEKSMAKMEQADVVLYLFDVNEISKSELLTSIYEMEEKKIKYLLVGNKVDIASDELLAAKFSEIPVLFISAAVKQNIDVLKNRLVDLMIAGELHTESTVITNARHYHSLKLVDQSLKEIRTGMDSGLPGDLLSLDIRRCLHFLGEITGEITNEDQLDYIFSKFCIGK
jgi:tRNA modification GTPase